MIPKVIHYCWFGENEMSPLEKKCISSWHKYCPDFVIKEWNEKNFDINSCTFVKEAYAMKKWAFITDYVRLFVLANEGGVYMDTDVEVIKPLDELLNERAFTGFEDSCHVSTGIIASEKNLPVLWELLSYYKNAHFILNNRDLNMITNVEIITNYMQKRGLVLNNSKQTIDGISFYPSCVFCPKSHETGKIISNSDTYTIHHFAGSWVPYEEKVTTSTRLRMRELFGRKWGDFVTDITMFPYRMIIEIKSKGFIASWKLAVKLIRRRKNRRKANT